MTWIGTRLQTQVVEGDRLNQQWVVVLHIGDPLINRPHGHALGWVGCEQLPELRLPDWLLGTERWP